MLFFHVAAAGVLLGGIRQLASSHLAALPAVWAQPHPHVHTLYHGCCWAPLLALHLRLQDFCSDGVLWVSCGAALVPPAGPSTPGPPSSLLEGGRGELQNKHVCFSRLGGDHLGVNVFFLLGFVVCLQAAVRVCCLLPGGSWGSTTSSVPHQCPAVPASCLWEDGCSQPLLLTPVLPKAGISFPGQWRVPWCKQPEQ